MAELTVYRVRSWAWLARTAEIQLDGQPVGTLRSKQRLTVPLEAGSHTLRASIGNTRTPEIHAEITEQSTHTFALTALTVEGSSHPLRLVPADDVDAGGLTVRDLMRAWRNRPPLGYRRRSPTEQVIWFLALVVLVTSQVLSHTGHHQLGAILSIPAGLVILVTAFRLFIYRPDK